MAKLKELLLGDRKVYMRTPRGRQLRPVILAQQEATKISQEDKVGMQLVTEDIVVEAVRTCVRFPDSIDSIDPVLDTDDALDLAIDAQADGESFLNTELVQTALRMCRLGGMVGKAPKSKSADGGAPGSSKSSK